MENSLFGAKKRNGETPISLGVPIMEHRAVHSTKTLVIKVHLSFHGPKTKVAPKHTNQMLIISTTFHRAFFKL